MNDRTAWSINLCRAMRAKPDYVLRQQLSEVRKLINKRIGKYVESAIHKAGFKQSDIVQKLQISSQQFDLRLRGMREFDLSDFVVIANTIGDYFLLGLMRALLESEVEMEALKERRVQEQES